MALRSFSPHTHHSMNMSYVLRYIGPLFHFHVAMRTLKSGLHSALVMLVTILAPFVLEAFQAILAVERRVAGSTVANSYCDVCCRFTAADARQRVLDITFGKTRQMLHSGSNTMHYTSTRYLVKTSWNKYRGNSVQHSHICGCAILVDHLQSPNHIDTKLNNIRRASFSLIHVC